MKDRTLRALRDELLDAARHYARESDGGANPLEAGAKLRLAAKVFERAEREVQAAERAHASPPSLSARQELVSKAYGLPVVRTTDVEEPCFDEADVRPA